jgi:cell division protein FtsZ
MFEIANQNQKQMAGAKIRVIGIGGGGCNAVNTMIKAGLNGVEYIVANTDAQALNASLAPTKIQLGAEITKGLGAGANPEVGRKAALEEYEKLSEVLEGSDMVFITAGMGGGTGTGAAPIVAKLCKELGALTVGVVTKPFLFEGKKRFKQADAGISILEETVDSLITIPNQRLLAIAGDTLSLVDTFKKADEVLLHAVQGISDLITTTGLINSDFADVNTIMGNKGLALMGTGIAHGPDRAIKAATEAISSPLLEDITIDGATGIIINITAGSSLTAHETNEAVTLIMEAADEDAEIIFGTVIDDEMGENVKVTVIATGLGGQPKTLAKSAPSQSYESTKSVSYQTSQPSSYVQNESIAKPTSVSAAHHEPIEENHRSGLAATIKKVANEYNEQKNNVSTLKEESVVSNHKMDGQASIQKSRAQSLAEKLGFINFDEEELDKPTFLRNARGEQQPPSA